MQAERLDLVGHGGGTLGRTRRSVTINGVGFTQDRHLDDKSANLRCPYNGPETAFGELDPALSATIYPGAAVAAGPTHRRLTAQLRPVSFDWASTAKRAVLIDSQGVLKDEAHAKALSGRYSGGRFGDEDTRSLTAEFAVRPSNVLRHFELSRRPN